MVYQIDTENALVYLLELDKENKGVSANDLDELACKVAKCFQTCIYIDKDLISLKHVAEDNPLQFNYFNHRVYIEVLALLGGGSKMIRINFNSL